MVAALRTDTAALPLLLEPDEPPPNAVRWAGWRFTGTGIPWYVREHADDARGAWAQWLIARYVLTDVTRGQLAAEASISVRGLQSILKGEIDAPYTRPVLAAFRRLGIGTTRGRWRDEATRPREIAVASRSLMARAAEALAGKPMAAEARDQLVADLRLLSAVAAFDRGSAR